MLALSPRAPDEPWVGSVFRQVDHLWKDEQIDRSEALRVVIASWLSTVIGTIFPCPAQDVRTGDDETLEGDDNRSVRRPGRLFRTRGVSCLWRRRLG